jgi:predicted Zn-dependent protease with MMP-like domain
MQTDRSLPDPDSPRDWAWAALTAAWEGGDYPRVAELAEHWLQSYPGDRDFHLWAADGLGMERRFTAAASHLQGLLAADPVDAEAMARLGHLYFRSGNMRDAEILFEQALAVRDDWADTHYGIGLVAERRRDFVAAERAFATAHRLDPNGFPLPVRLTDGEFDRCVQEAIDMLPPEFQEQLESISILVQDLPDDDSMRAVDPPDPELLGLFTGPSHMDHQSGGLPDLPPTIILYRRNLERLASDPHHLMDEIVTTLYHELGHYLGWDEDEVGRHGLA